MAAIGVNVKRVQRMWDDFGQSTGEAHAVPDLDADLAKARWLATLFDAQFSIGGIRFGLDAIVGLIPAAGNLVGYLAGGSVPLIGDVIDVGFKAQLKILKLLERAAEKKRRA